MIPNDIFIAFDLECLRQGSNINNSAILLLKALARYKPNKIIVWSEDGSEIAEAFGRKYHLDDHVWSYWPKIKLEDQDIQIDISIGYHKDSCGRNNICLTI
jgi:hypothetical protein